MAKIVIVDDSPIVHRLLENRIRAAGHEVVGHALDGNSGFEEFRKCSPDLVLLDITMPACDGRQCLKKIMALAPTAKVLMLSALSSPEMVNECLKIGAVGFVSKDRLPESGYLEAQLEEIIAAPEAA